jgi:hypothetical protein
MHPVLKSKNTTVTNVYGTPSIVGLGYLNGGDNLIALGDITIANFETITIKPYDYCYIGGIENGHVKKNMYITTETEVTKGLLIMKPGIVYSIQKLPNEGPLTHFRVSYSQ